MARGGLPEAAEAVHYILDLWAHQWRRRHAHGRVVIVRYTDDFVTGFEKKVDAEERPA